MQLGLEIAKRIRELRIKKGYTQEILAAKIGIDPSFLGRIERGQSVNLQVNTLEKIIVDGLDESYTSFFAFEGTKDRKLTLVNQLSTSKNEDELLDIFERILSVDRK